MGCSQVVRHQTLTLAFRWFEPSHPSQKSESLLSDFSFVSAGHNIIGRSPHHLRCQPQLHCPPCGHKTMLHFVQMKCFAMKLPSANDVATTSQTEFSRLFGLLICSCFFIQKYTIIKLSKGGEIVREDIDFTYKKCYNSD